RVMLTTLDGQAVCMRNFVPWKDLSITEGLRDAIIYRRMKERSFHDFLVRSAKQHPGLRRRPSAPLKNTLQRCGTRDAAAPDAGQRLTTALLQLIFQRREQRSSQAAFPMRSLAEQRQKLCVMAGCII